MRIFDYKYTIKKKIVELVHLQPLQRLIVLIFNQTSLLFETAEQFYDTQRLQAHKKLFQYHSEGKYLTFLPAAEQQVATLRSSTLPMGDIYFWEMTVVFIRQDDDDLRLEHYNISASLKANASSVSYFSPSNKITDF